MSPNRRCLGRPSVLLALALASGCVDRESPLGPVETPDPGGPLVSELVQVRCEVDVAAESLACEPLERRGEPGPLLDRIVGAQDMYVKLASFGTSYDAGTETLQSNVTLQNLLAQNIGTSDGAMIQGAYVFFVQGPEVTSGNGNVSVDNADGTGTFTATDQAYFHFSQILTPYQISSPKTWQFQVDPSVGTFSFLVYVSAPVQDDVALLDVVWEGGLDSAWEAPGNWMSSVMPDSTSVVSVFPETMLEGASMPVLAVGDTVAHLRVGAGSTLDLGANALLVRGNVDASGPIANGILGMSGEGALLQGTVDGLDISGSTSLQGPTTASGAISIIGSLNTNGQPLTIAIP